MNKVEIEKIVQEKLTDKRYTHTLGVTETALQLAEKFGEDKDKVYIAAMLHDIAKCMTIDEQRVYAKHLCEITYIESFSKELLHAYAGAYIAKTELNIYDEEIISAIEHHTTGQENMTKLEKIIFLADFIEPNRNFPGVEEAREIVFEDLDYGMQHVLGHTMKFLINKGQRVFPKTLDTYNYFTLLNNKRRTL